MDFQLPSIYGASFPLLQNAGSEMPRSNVFSLDAQTPMFSLAFQPQCSGFDTMRDVDFPIIQKAEIPDKTNKVATNSFNTTTKHDGAPQDSSELAVFAKMTLKYQFKNNCRPYHQNQPTRYNFSIPMGHPTFSILFPNAVTIRERVAIPKGYPKERRLVTYRTFKVEDPRELNEFFDDTDWYNVRVDDCVGTISNITFRLKIHIRTEFQTVPQAERAHEVLPGSKRMTFGPECQVSFTMTRIVIPYM